MVKLRFKSEYIGLKIFENLVNLNSDYSNHFIVHAPGICTKEQRGNKGRGMVYCTLSDMMTARAVPLNVLRVSRPKELLDAAREYAEEAASRIKPEGALHDAEYDALVQWHEFYFIATN